LSCLISSRAHDTPVSAMHNLFCKPCLVCLDFPGEEKDKTFPLFCPRLGLAWDLEGRGDRQVGIDGEGGGMSDQERGYEV